MMDTRERLENSLKDALRSKDEVQKRTIRLALSSIKFEDKTKGILLDEAGVINVLQKEVKIRQEAVLDAQKANRPDLIENNEAEIVILETFLPKQLSENEIKALVDSAIQETGAKGPGDMGKVMKVVLPKIQGRAPNDQISKAVRQALNP
jgi:uncharacterized protein